MSITITVPNDDHVALRAMAKALEEIAVARGASLQVNLVTQEMLDKLKETRAGNIVCEPEVDTTSEQVESLSSVVNREVHFDNPSPQVSDATTDSTDTPWDERIHSASKALNSDGTWRLRRKPADMVPSAWESYIEEIKHELKWDSRQLGASEERVQVVEDLCIDEGCDHHGTSHVCITPEPSVTPASDDFHVDAGEVTEQQIAAIPVPPLPVPPVQHSDMTFPQVMQFLTERHGRITSAQVDDIIADMGLNSIMDLNTQPEHTGPFIARVKSLLGE